jgi:hypothetical protein
MYKKLIGIALLGCSLSLSGCFVIQHHHGGHHHGHSKVYRTYACDHYSYNKTQRTCAIQPCANYSW